jgi:hypothetical protein
MPSGFWTGGVRGGQGGGNDDGGDGDPEGADIGLPMILLDSKQR